MWAIISQRNQKSKHNASVDALENNYVTYLERFGIKLLPIPNTTKNLNSYFNEFHVHGIILTGGEDISEALYNNTNEKISVREVIEKKLLEIAVRRKIPVLGICRGMQFINVFFKGKLIKNIKEEIGDKIQHVAANHTVKILDNKLIKPLGREIEVNSYHNQGIDSDSLSAELKLFAQTFDGIIEGLYHPKFPIAGIQWHLERKSPDNAVNSKIIKAFIEGDLFWK